MYYQAIDGFYSRATQLRQVFDRRFVNPLDTHPDRFVWDFWHVPGEYTYLRTPAFHYFPKNVYEPFHRYLVRWGRENLGCHDISPPWLSCYIEGCRQEPHRDLPHGPLAFVYSLTPKKRKFTGGETFIGGNKNRIAPEFNRLTLFNPSVLHGVRPVKGTMDPREGRLVIHGWFVNPRPFWVGPLNAAEVMEGINNGLKGLNLKARDRGLISLRMHIQKAGKVASAKVLLHTLSPRDHRQIAKILDLTRDLTFAPRRSSTVLTLPLLIEP